MIDNINTQGKGVKMEPLNVNELKQKESCPKCKSTDAFKVHFGQF